MGTVILFSEVHEANASSWITLIVSGRVILTIDEQFANAFLLMVSTAPLSSASPPRMTVVRDLAPSNMLTSIVGQ